MPKKAINKEALLDTILDAYYTQKFLSLRKVADYYRVSYSKLRGRKNR
jgi:hypothetical protein